MRFENLKMRIAYLLPRDIAYWAARSVYGKEKMMKKELQQFEMTLAEAEDAGSMELRTILNGHWCGEFVRITILVEEIEEE